MVCDPETVHFKEEVNGNMNSTNSSPSIVQLYSHTQSGGKQWNIEALYESCRLRVLMASSGQMSKMVMNVSICQPFMTLIRS
jgi:hypothetical protein